MAMGGGKLASTAPNSTNFQSHGTPTPQNAKAPALYAASPFAEPARGQ